MTPTGELNEGFQPTYEELKLEGIAHRIAALCTFSAYLRGIETTEGEDNGVYHRQFSAYLRGIETP